MIFIGESQWLVHVVAFIWSLCTLFNNSCLWVVVGKKLANYFGCSRCLERPTYVVWVELLLPNAGTMFDIWIYTNFMVKHFFSRIFHHLVTQKNKIQICKNPDCRWACGWNYLEKHLELVHNQLGKKLSQVLRPSPCVQLT